jgi:molybdenum cofactor biosynthesis protein B
VTATPYNQHAAAAAGLSARCAIITLSDTRTETTDKSGQKIRELLTAASHSVVHYQIVKDDPGELSPLLQSLLARADADVILTNGGTGISRRDQTIQVIEKAIERPLPGFGELFRMLSWEQIGSGAMLSRAAGGIAAGKLLFAMPGSTAAVELAMTRLILPELKHLLHELRK